MTFEKGNVIVPFSFRPDEIWTISGPRTAVEAVLEAVGIGAPEPENTEEIHAEPVDESTPSPEPW